MRYLVVRALLFVVPFSVLMVAGVPWVLSLLVALAFAFAASIVFFAQLRQQAAADLQRMREGRKRDEVGPDDGDVEDAVLDGRRERPADGADVAERREGDAADEPDASARP